MDNKILMVLLSFTILILSIINLDNYIFNDEPNIVQLEKQLKKIEKEITLNSKTLSELSGAYQRLDLQIRGIAAECGKITLECKNDN